MSQIISHAKIEERMVGAIVKKGKQTKTEIEYKRFDTAVKVSMYFALALTIAFVILFLFVKPDELKILFGSLLVLDTVAIIFIVSKITKKRTAYLQLLQDERNTIVRTGLFKKIYDAYNQDGFEFNLTYDKLLFEEYHNNSIDIGILKNNHEFLIEIDEKAISIIVDEEDDHPVETEILLLNIATMEQLYLTINCFINEHS